MANEKFDVVSIQRINTAHPKLRAELAKIYYEANNKLGKSRLRFSYVFRTFKEQTELFAIGRTTGKKGAIVTNAKAGQSMHNYGLAVDIVLLIDKDGDGKLETASWDIHKDWDGDMIADWKEVVQVFKKYGWEYGGDWRFKDFPHFEKTFGKSWKELKSLHDAKKVDKDGFVLL